MSPIKLRVDVFVAFGSCVCMYENFLDRVMAVLNPYRENMTIEVKNAATPEGEKYNLFESTIILNGDRKFTRVDSLKRYIESYFATAEIE